MRAFLSKFLLSIFIVIFSLPLSALAQENSWTPPSGPPLGNNTPAPINEGIFPQTKRGGLRLDTNTTFIGSSFQNFLPSFFLNGVQIGGLANPVNGLGGVGPTLSIFGNLKYTPTYQDGTPTDTQPQPGYVLTALDTEGNVGWVPASGLPNGGNQGDTLIWDSTCNCWTTGPGGGASLPSATLGQTMWYNGTAWQATNQVLHGVLPDGVTTFTRIPNRDITIGTLGVGRTLISSTLVDIPATEMNIGTGALGQQTNIKSPIVRIPLNNASCAPVCPGPDPTGKVLVAQDSTGRLGWVDPSTVLGGGLPSAEQGNTLWYNNGVWEATSKINHTDSETIVDSSLFKIRGSVSSPGSGRIPYAVDDEGTFKWNDRFTYQLNQGGMFPVPVGQLTLLNPQNGLAVFRNQGLTSLVDDVRIGESQGSGQLYLDGLGTGTIFERTQGLVQPLCYSTATKRVITCDTDLPAQDPGDVGGGGVLTGTQGEGVVVYTPDSETNIHTFNISGTVQVKYCSGGGGGGGGGYGRPSGTNNNPGTGGAGGGGGAAGECENLDLDVTPGDILRFEIGEGGNGGGGASYYINGGTVNNNISQAGSSGEQTRLFFTDNGGSETQLGQTLFGGNGGLPGASADGSNNSPVGGAHGNLSFNIGGDAWWWRGQEGLLSTFSTCQSCGGHGGVGESYDSDGDILGPNQVSTGQPSYRGGGGYSGNNESTLDGGNGRCGLYSYGGGGGGGSYGQYVVDFPALSMEGGDGGCGGDGYVQISGLMDPTQGNVIEFTTPGSHTLTNNMLSMIPVGATITVEVWGAGGGGGGSQQFSVAPFGQPQPIAENSAGGGGAGGYIRRNIIRPNSPVQITVGAGGTAGVSSTTTSSVTNGGNGGSSSYSNLSTANGGFGGERSLASVSVNDAIATGGGGVGGTAIGGGGPVIQNGQNGQDGNTSLVNPQPSSGGQGHPSVAGGSLYGAGGSGAEEVSGPTFFSSQSGANGRVRITW
jgi:hypothetical protein